MDAELDEAERAEIPRVLESYLLRRAVCNLGTKNYNRIFLSLTKNLQKERFNAQRLKANLDSQLAVSGRLYECLQLFEASETDPRAVATRKRERALQTLGNLTILSTGLNTAQSNLCWDQKRPEMMKHPLLPINQTLWETTWDEVAILNAERSSSSEQ